MNEWKLDSLSAGLSQEDNYISLVDLAAKSVFGFDFLLAEVLAGRLKAFKVGDDWFTNEDWIDQHKKNIKDKISSEVAGSGYQKWVCYLPDKKKASNRSRKIKLKLSIGRFNPRFGLALSLPVIFLIFWFFGWLLALPIIDASAWRPDSDSANSFRRFWGTEIINTTNNFYSASIDGLTLSALSFASGINKVSGFVIVTRDKSNKQIVRLGNRVVEAAVYPPDKELNDELITDRWQYVLTVAGDRAENTAGRVAGVMENPIKLENDYELWQQDNNLSPKDESVRSVGDYWSDFWHWLGLLIDQLIN